MKNISTLSVAEDGGIYYYLISARWIQKWRDFCNMTGPYPGRISNREIGDAVYHARARQGRDCYLLADDHIAIDTDQQLCFIVSEEFWTAFRERFDADVTI